MEHRDDDGAADPGSGPVPGPDGDGPGNLTDGDAVGDGDTDRDHGEATDVDGGPGDDGDDGDDTDPGPTRFDRIRKHSAAGIMMSGIALGLQEALGPVRNEPAVVFEVSGDPPAPPGPVELKIDFDHPERTVAIVRPWLVDGTTATGDAEGAETPGPDAPDGPPTDLGP
jgi:hypothetical protein